MPKTHIVREAFSLDGKDYPRGSEITDHAVLKQVCEKFPGHLVRQHHEASATPAPAPEQAPAEKKA